MRAIILIGSALQKQEFVKKYIEENNIATYNIFKFDEALKISDAREIIRTLNYATSSGKKRLILVNSDPNTEAQNALLKLLEELSAETDFIFAGEAPLLPTINSRCQIIRLGNEQVKVIEYDTELIDGFTNGNTADQMLVIDSIFSQKDEKAFENLILGLREDILKRIDSGNFDILEKFNILKLLNSYNRLVVSNNLNPRLQIEKILLRPIDNKNNL